MNDKGDAYYKYTYSHLTKTSIYVYMNTVYSRLTQINIYIYLHLSKDKYIRMCVEHMTLRKFVIGYVYSHLTKTNIYVYANSVITSTKDKHIRIFGQKTNIYVYA